VEFEGEEFPRSLDKDHPELTRQPRRVRVVSGIDVKTGEIFFMPASGSAVHPEDFPHIPLDEADGKHTYDNVAGAQLRTVRSHGASTSGVDMDKVYRSRGGDPRYKPKKTGGFKFPTTAGELYKGK